ncbi:MAG: choice-of-anchor B family protein [Gemmatimonadota bacterium]
MTRVAHMLLALAVAIVACGDQPTSPNSGSDPSDDPGDGDDPIPAEVVIAPPAVTFDRFGETATFEATVLDSAGVELSDPSVNWSSSNPGAVDVDASGRATAKGVGTAVVLARSGAAQQGASAAFEPAAVTGGEVACSGGTAAGFPCDGVDLVSYLPLSELGAPAQVELNDMWGWKDSTTSREYALVGRTDGISFVDVTDPLNPAVVGFLPSPTTAALWRDVKVYANHAYVVADGSLGHGVQIFDLTRLRGATGAMTFDEDGRYTEVSSVHNIAINEATGFAYTVGNNGGGNPCGPGLHVIDLSDPASPTFAGCFTDPTTGRSLTGYTHDVQCVIYDGPDAEHAGREICIGSNETALSIADVTDKDEPVALSTGSYPDAAYVHQGWLTEDHRYFIQNDELDELNGAQASTRMLVWDVEDLDDPILVEEHFGPSGATDHNLYVRGDLLFHSNYHFGLRVVDVSNPTAPVELGYFDTHPSDDDPGFKGSWSNYPWFDDGIIGVTSAREGFFLLRIR